MKRIIMAAALLLSTPASAGLTGTELSLRTLAQATSSSTPFITSFERTVIVSSAVEYPDVASLFNPATGVPPGFARSLVNIAIDVGNDYIEIDFDNAGSGTFASGGRDAGRSAPARRRRRPATAARGPEPSRPRGPRRAVQEHPHLAGVPLLAHDEVVALAADEGELLAAQADEPTGAALLLARLHAEIRGRPHERGRSE